MISFVEWMKLQESGVPDVVDLTKPADQGVTYWGAVPKTGSLSKNQKKKKADEIKAGIITTQKSL